MDFSAVVLAHVNWKKRFAAHLVGGEKLNATAVERDDLCELGKWIHSHPQLGHMPEYQKLKEKHAHFHRAAADAVRKSSGMPIEQARQLVEPGGDYALASAACVTAITAVREKLTRR